MKTLKVLKGLEKEKKLSKKKLIQKKLSPIERILAVTTGSVTQILEAYLGEPVKIRTLSQEVKGAGDIADLLGVGKKEEVNFREVEITDQKGRVLLTAKSWTPLKRLEPAFRSDLMKADVPIGKLLEKHKIDARRELLDVVIGGDGRLKRTYDIIRNNEILMRISEKFERI